MGEREVGEEIEIKCMYVGFRLGRLTRTLESSPNINVK